MAKVRWTKGASKLAGVALLVPPLFMAAQLGPGGVPEAEGCGGSGTGAAGFPAPVLRVHRNTGDLIQPVATDGFFLLDTSGYLPSMLVATASVSVTTTAGVPVPGALKVWTGRQSYLGWEASAPIPVGTSLSVTITVPPTAGLIAGEVTQLNVVGEPTALTTPALTFSKWYDQHHGIGDTWTCFPNTPCSYALANVRTQEELIHSADITTHADSPIVGNVLWEVELVPAPEEAPLSLLKPGVIMGEAMQPLDVGRIGFPRAATEFCATVHVTDLRSGLTLPVHECAPPTPTDSFTDYDDLARCKEPPSPELTAAWCGEHPESTLPACQPDEEPGRDPTPNDSTPPNPNTSNETNASGPSSARTSSACALNPGPAHGTGIGFLVGALALAGGFRRARRPTCGWLRRLRAAASARSRHV